MKKLLFHLHTYGGLLFFPLMLIFGLSALHINHSLRFMEPQGEWNGTRHHVNIQDNPDRQKLAETIRDSLSLMGWCPYWTQKRNGDRFSFDITHNGADYRIIADIASGSVELKRRPKGFGAVMNSLHFFNEELPSGTGIVNSWKYFKDLCFVYLLIAITTGIWMFARKKKRIPGFAALLTACAFSVFIFVYVWLAG